MLRLLAFLITFMIAHPAQATPTMFVDAPSDHFLNLRSGPSTGYHVIRKMPHGSRVTVLARPGKWYKVRHASGLTGWAHSRFLSHHPAAVTADPPQTAPLQRYVSAPRHGALNLRGGPGTGYPVLQTMRHGAAVTLLGHDGDWQLVQHLRSGQVGWAHGNYLTRARTDLPRLVPRREQQPPRVRHQRHDQHPQHPRQRAKSGHQGDWVQMVQRCAQLPEHAMQRCLLRWLERGYGQGSHGPRSW